MSIEAGESAASRLGARLRRELGELLLPQRCIACSRFGAALHDGCVGLLTAAGGTRCTRCWRPGAGTWCERCAAGGTQAPAFDGLRAPFRFEGLARRAVLEAKFRRVTALLPPLAREAAASVPAEWTPEAVVPVPLHPARERRRGFNQAEHIARTVAEVLALPERTDLVRRVRETPPQATLDAVRRERNLGDAFAAHGPVPPRLLLVDDVTTTGATLGAVAATLRAAGAEQVWALALARED
ncbi:MAG: ComF family protein [Dehalococcoidia bacterium]|nr:ComF family protein [Dehalococcoidia bacterium]